MSQQNNVHIDWSQNGKVEFFGINVSTPEKIINWAGASILPAFMLYAYFTGKVDWSLGLLIIAILLGLDIGGGMITTATNSFKRLYFSPVTENDKAVTKFGKNHLLFSLAHIHPIVLYLIFDISNWYIGVIWYVLFALSAVVVLNTPLYLQRPVALLLTLLAIAINVYIIAPIPGFEWFIPVFYLKIIAGHNLREEPYTKPA